MWCERVGVGGGCVMIKLQVGVVELQNHGGLVVLRWEGRRWFGCV